MKAIERESVRRLRRQGYSLNEIVAQVRVSKSSASVWVRDIELSPEQIERLRDKFGSRSAGREVFRQTMRARRDARWAVFHQEAAAEYAALSQDPAFMFGLALYIGEGSKSCSSRVALTNCEAGVIVAGLAFFLLIGVGREQIGVDINLHPGLCETMARSHWQQVTRLPFEQIHNTVWAVSRASAGKKGNLQPYGTCRITTHSTRLRQKLEVWMNLALYGVSERPEPPAIE